MNERVLRIEGIRQCRLSTNLRIFMVKNKTIKRRAVYEIPMKKFKLTFVCLQPVLRIRIRDPGLGAF